MKINKLIIIFFLAGFLFPPACKKAEKQMLVSTGTVSNISMTSADVSGKILDLGEGVTSYGHCYATTPNTTVAGPKIEISVAASVRSFTSNITGLTPGTKYYVTAYCSRGEQTVYGDEIYFTTMSDAKPEVTTSEITGIDKTTAVSGGNVKNEGGTSVSARGICWSLATNPTTDNYKAQSGSGTGSFTCNLSGLTPDKKYYVRAYATNLGGTSYGEERNFITLPDVPISPTVTTDEVSSVTTNSAFCGGNVTAEGSAAVTAKGVCWGTNSTPTIEVNNKTNDGTGTGHFNSTIIGLDPGTKYYVRAYAINSVDKAYGTTYDFTTIAVIPTLNTLPVTSVTSTTASSGGDILSTGGASITSKGVCWKTSPGPTIFDNKTENGNSPDDFVSSLTSLQPGTKYYLRAYATNSVGPGYGEELEFTTFLPPVVSTGEATSISRTSATMNGMVNANGQSTVVTFEYGLTSGYGMNMNAIQSPVNGIDNIAVNAGITGLSEGTVYHVRAKAVSIGGTSYGDDKMFTTLCNSPTAATASATNITSTSATLNGLINANGFSTKVTFEYGTSTAYESSITALQSPVSGSSPTTVNVNVTGLSVNTLYYFRIKAENCGGIVYSTDLSTFSTGCTSPLATTATATGIGPTSALLNATVNPNGSSTTVKFEYGTSISYGSTITASQSPATGTAIIPVTAALSGLEPNKTYHYRVVADNCGGTGNGSDQLFTTNCFAPSATTSPVTAIGTTSATLNGTVNANSFSTTVTFEYGPTTGYGNSITAIQSPVTGTSNTSVNANISSLTSNSVYHYRVKAVNCSPNATEGNDLNFTTLAMVSTASVSNITGTSASGGGNVTAGGGASITTRGVCWSTSANPTIADSKTVDGTGTGIFTSNISGLTPCTNYHLRAYVTNASGTTYGVDIPFTSGIGLATVSTSAISAVTMTTATFGGNVTGSCASTVTARGVCWNTSISPTIANYKTIDGSGAGNFTSNLTGLLVNTRYYVRAYATNSFGTSYGLEVTFVTDPFTISDIEGNTYDVVRIGTQLWTGNDMAASKYNDNTSIPLVTDNSAWMSTSSAAYCWYNNSVPVNKKIYGAIYNWYVVNSGKICPSGWHVPTDLEWNTLEIYLQNNGYNYDGTIDTDNSRETNNKTAKSLSYTGFWGSSTIVGSVGNTDFPEYRNKTSFAARPGGGRGYSDGEFSNVTYSEYWWTSTEASSTEATNRAVLNYRVDVWRYTFPKGQGVHIRCLRDF